MVVFWKMWSMIHQYKVILITSGRVVILVMVVAVAVAVAVAVVAAVDGTHDRSSCERRCRGCTMSNEVYRKSNNRYGGHGV